MPHYGLKYTRRIDYENGPSNTKFIRIIKCDYPSIPEAMTALRARLQEFIDLWNSFHTESGWAEQTAALKELRKERKELSENAKEDLSFLSGSNAEAYAADHADQVITITQKIDALTAEIENIKTDLYARLHTQPGEPAIDNDDEWDEPKKKPLLRLPEWQQIPGFGELTIETLFGDITYSRNDSAISQPSFELITLDDALTILEKHAITY